MIKISEKTFKTNKEAWEFIHTILYSYEINKPLENENLIFISDLLNLHPEAKNKIGTGIKSIIIENEKRFNKTKHFSVIRLDNTIADFSFEKCLSSNLNEPQKLFNSCAREAVANQIILFKDNFFLENQDSKGNVSCQITKVLVNKENCHIDHIPPNTFDKITSDFIKINNIDVNEIKFAEESNGIGRVFVDSNLKDNFADYHKQTAKLRVVLSTANLKQKKK